MEITVNLETGNSLVPIEPQTYIGLNFFQGQFLPEVINIDTWRESFSEDAGRIKAISDTQNEASICKSEKEIREFMDDKLIVSMLHTATWPRRVRNPITTS